jgi:hypothetical protein
MMALSANAGIAGMTGMGYCKLMENPAYVRGD